jgi:hypothetical protein
LGYLYIDEAGRYANRNLADLLAYKRKSGLRVTIAHQYFKQFEDAQVLDAVKNLTKIKVMFNTPNHSDRLEMIKALGYGGDIPHEMATYANQNLPKQQAIIKVGKDSPRRIKIPDVPDIKIDKKVEEEFTLRLLANPWNFTPREVRDQIHNRFYDRSVQPNPKSPAPRKAPNRKATSAAPVPAGIRKRRDEQSVPAGNEEP